MTSQPPPGGYDPSQGPQPWGQQPYGQAYGQPYGASAPPPYGPPAGQPWAAPPQPTSTAGRRRPRMADWALPAGAALYLLFALLPWMTSDEGGTVSVNGFDSSVSSEFFGFPFDVSVGYSSALVVCAWVLLLLAALWAFLPSLGKGHVVQVSFAREGVTVLLTGLAFLLTFITWVQTLSIGDVADGLDGGSFSVMAFLTLLTSLAVLVVAVLSLLPALRHRAKVPGAVAGAAQWVNQPGPAFGAPGQAGSPPPGPQGARQQETWQQGTWGQPPAPQPYGQPLPPPPPAQAAAPETPPQAPPPGTGSTEG
jgi:hypothetical protein